MMSFVERKAEEESEGIPLQAKRNGYTKNQQLKYNHVSNKHTSVRIVQWFYLSGSRLNCFSIIKPIKHRI